MKNIAVFGASGAIGGAFVRALAQRPDTQTIHAYSRTRCDFVSDKVILHSLDFEDEVQLAAEARSLASVGGIDAVLVCVGMLHDDDVMPEKSLNDLSAEKFQRLFQTNTIIPSLIAKHFVRLLPKDDIGLFAVLSARVGSISDNRLGGWYAYRASKAALNMVIKNTAIEMGRRYKKSIIVGLHPGTVDSDLSLPFQKNVKPEKLFSPGQSASYLLSVLDQLTPENSGKCFDWAGKEVEA